MPYVTVKMLEGRTEEQKRNLVEKVTEAVAETTGAPLRTSLSSSRKCRKTIMQSRKAMERRGIKETM